MVDLAHLACSASPYLTAYIEPHLAILKVPGHERARMSARRPPQPCARISARAHAETVAPVVSTSSTSSTQRPARESPRFRPALGMRRAHCPRAVSTASDQSAGVSGRTRSSACGAYVSPVWLRQRACKLGCLVEAAQEKPPPVKRDRHDQRGSRRSGPCRRAPSTRAIHGSKLGSVTEFQALHHPPGHMSP
jgi:hypothetical protein